METGSGQQRRCFAYVGDVVEALVALMNLPAAAGRVYNIGTTEEISIEALADKIIAATQSRSEKKFLSYQEAYGKPFDDMDRRVPCLERLNETIGFQPSTTLEESLRLIIDDFKGKTPRGQI